MKKGDLREYLRIPSFFFINIYSRKKAILNYLCENA